ncbi:peptidase M23 [Marinobacterium zhoushanense]|uniref:Peptidase M23 n=1 Tax=Marinobacterium zhoushanense TaxID=1679163 RepID=A0ABQ1KLZ0_9GAMM|nr:peptidoglycan DD-metalloendopeptidase family protein [Marinobacterium zhoushanense]GGC00317.1 peptidase M23 [Marinobacterium zhoushanense]
MIHSLPKVHLAAASICTLILGTTLLLLPSEEVEATRSTITLIPAKAKTSQNAQASLTPSQNDTAEYTESNLLDQPPNLTDTSTPELTSTNVEEATLPPIVENWIDYDVRSGDNLTSIFKRAGLSARDVYQISQATSENQVLSRLYPGQTLSFLIQEGELQKLRFAQDRLNSVEIVRTEAGYDTQIVSRTPDIKTHIVSGTINSSLFVDAARAGLSDNMIMQMAQILGWDIDFALDIREHDRFRVLYEEKYLDDEKIGEGDILAVEFVNQGETFAAVRYTDSNGNSNYFTPGGHSMRKAFLRSPVDFRRISSGFNPSRLHPVLGTKRPHRGVDYAAATGTPIKASGDGKIIWRGTKGGYGRAIIIQHGGNITTLYGHMSGYKSGLSTGSRVKQGQTIGYVGMSGLASGPHLHYEFRVNGVHKNPMTVKLPHAEPVPKSEQAAFKQQASRLMAMLDGGTTGIALNDN